MTGVTAGLSHTDAVDVLDALNELISEARETAYAALEAELRAKVLDMDDDDPDGLI
jgi:hypothetical protein